MQFEDDSEMEGVLEVKSSCVSLDMLCVMCLTTSFLCVYAEERVVISYGCFFTLKLQNATFLSRSVQAL